MSTTMNEADSNTYVVPVEVLCITCKQPIKAWINSPNWLRVEWVSPSGECRACNQETMAKETGNGRI